MATNLTSHFVSATTTIDSNAGRIRGYNFTSHSTAVKSVVFHDNYVSAGDTGTQVLKIELNSGIKILELNMKLKIFCGK